jgi:hypothetical protein
MAKWWAVADLNFLSVVSYLVFDNLVVTKMLNIGTVELASIAS